MAFNLVKETKNNTACLNILIAKSKEGPSKKLTQEEVNTLQSYKGFGGIKEILYPDDSVDLWKNKSPELKTAIIEFKERLFDYCETIGKSYNKYLTEINNSTQTAFYTPQVITNVIAETVSSLQHPNSSGNILEPSCGHGSFISALRNKYLPINDTINIYGIEKDSLTADIARVLHRRVDLKENITIKTNVLGSAFEKADLKNSNYSLVISNVPFGDIQVFDKQYFENRKNKTDYEKFIEDFAQKSLHNYFAYKAIDVAEDNGIVALITTGGFANSHGNEPIRHAILKRAQLISAVRFPDTLFKEDANTEAPSDLFVFRKFPNGQRPADQKFSTSEEQFLYTDKSNNISWNRYFLENKNNIIHTDIVPGTNQYGNPNYEVKYKGSVEDIAKELNTLLLNDFSKSRVLERNEQIKLNVQPVLPKDNVELDQEPQPAKVVAQPNQQEPDNRPDVNDLYDLYFKASQKKIRKVTPKKAAAIIKQKTVDLFSQKQLQSFDLFSQPELKDPVPEKVEIKINPPKPLNQDPVHPASDLFGLELNLPQESQKDKSEPINKKEKATQIQNLGSFTYTAEHIINLSSFKEGMLYFDADDNFYQLYKNKFSEEPELRKIDIEDYAKENTTININTFDPIKIKAILNIRDAYNTLFDTEFKTQQEQPQLRQVLNDAYDVFVNRYGVLNKPLNKRYASLDQDFEFTITGVELPVPNLELAKVEYVKASIFESPVNILKSEFIVTDAKSALIYSINTFGHVDLDRMSEKSGINRTELEDKLSDYILFNPENKKHELRSIYLNENLYIRLEEFKRAIDSNLSEYEKIQYQSQLNQTERAIRDSIPPIIPFEDIDVALGERWIPTQVYQDFASDLFQTTVNIKYFNTNDEFKASAIGSSYEMRTFYTAQTLAGNKTSINLLESALLDETMIVTYKDHKTEQKYTDHKGTVVCNEIIQRIRGKFNEWLQEPKNEELRQRLTDIYNYKFNGISIQKFDGSLLTLDDVNWKNLGISKAYDSQKDSVMMLLCNQGGIVDHVPGGGKTLIECMTAHYMKKMGIAKKPIIIGLKANLDDLVAAHKKAFPQDKIIAPTDSDFEIKNRVKLFNQIKNNDWDCVFLTHNQFEKIPADPEIQAEMIREELRDLQLNLDSVTGSYDELSRRALKGLEKQRANLESNLEKTLAKINDRKDNLSHFGQLGIDHIIVDESHVFKNLQYSTRHSNVGGLGNTLGSQRAFNLKCALSTLQDKTGKDLQASFFSGTPISNSLTEMYLLFKYLTPNDLKRKQIINFDSWAAIFARKSSELELSLTNQLVVKERFREFTKVPELAKDYRRITDYRSAEDIGLKRPPIKEELIIAKPTDQQMEIFLDMQKFMKSGSSELFDFNSDSDSLKKAKGLIAANICAKTCLDVRFVMPEQPYQKGSKEYLLVENVFKFYSDPKLNEDKATQLIFLDSGVPGGQTFNLYQDIKDRLIDRGINPNEIAFIHDYGNQNVKPVLNQKMKDGAIRVLIGGTEKLGTGWNIQHRIIAMHNFDIPWKPSEYDQRKGRGQRSGNWLAEKYGGVHNFYYVTENSPEVAKVDRVKIKAGFINQIKNGSISVRKIDEGTMDEGSGLSYADIVMQTSGDPRYKEQNKLENIISKMELERASFQSIASRNKHKQATLEKSIPNHKANIESLKKDLADYTPNVKYIEKGEHKGEIQNETKIIGKDFSTEEQLGKYLIAISQTPMKEREKTIGSLYGFNIKMCENYIFGDRGKEACNTFEISKNGRAITYNGGLISEESPKRAARHFYYALNRIEALIDREDTALQKAEDEYKKVTENKNIQYPKEKELSELKKSLAKLTEDIKRDMNKRNDNNSEGEVNLAEEQKNQYQASKARGPKLSF